MVTLRKINMDNFEEVIHLKLSGSDKEMVASNLYSLAEAYADSVSIARAIYKDEFLVGFIMYDYNAIEQKGYISRLMIDMHHQGNGYAEAAMRIALTDLKTNPDIQRIQISYAPNNVKARALYYKLGFVENGETVADGELVAMIELNKQ
ncbi:MAG: GNAT family N-acetyltransferase [Bacilli bacterium]|nr:GNAT family N-acetyltransferase [Bacilli bacterium]MBN2876278.1 GNAT family N-acetyltransferase [Bacilli bacterium]